MRFKIIVLLFLANVSLAKDNWYEGSCKISDRELARQLIELQLSGYHLSDKSSCLNQRSFRNVQAVHSPSQDREVLAEFKYDDKDSYEVVSIKPVEPPLLKVDVKWRWNGLKKGPKKTSFYMRRYTHPKVIPNYGCGSIIRPFQKAIIRKECLGR